jgi:uncharacterized membrane-anchored protein YitT (DUF2179 family)
LGLCRFEGKGKTAELMLAGIFGGALAGAGVAISYLGNGSTGGFDIISFIIAKYSEMKQDVSGFIIDASLIVIGMICMRDPIQGSLAFWPPYLAPLRFSISTSTPIPLSSWTS